MKSSFLKDKLRVEIFHDTRQMGAASATFVASELRKAIEEKGVANLIIGTGASQYPFLDDFLREELDWKKINIFHLDEYLGISESHPASFRYFLRERVVSKVNPGNVFYLEGDSTDVAQEIERYERLLRENPADVACIGIGENGHIAFNDPDFADFNDPEYLKVVKLDEACRKQQVGEGWFPTIRDVPAKAITLTITAIMDCKALSCSVPDERKSEAVYNALMNEISTLCPASIIRRHNNAKLFLDRYSASKIFEKIQQKPK